MAHNGATGTKKRYIPSLFAFETKESLFSPLCNRWQTALGTRFDIFNGKRVTISLVFALCLPAVRALLRLFNGKLRVTKNFRGWEGGFVENRRLSVLLFLNAQNVQLFRGFTAPDRFCSSNFRSTDAFFSCPLYSWRSPFFYIKRLEHWNACL